MTNPMISEVVAGVESGISILVGLCVISTFLWFAAKHVKSAMMSRCRAKLRVYVLA